jgi:NAD(P)-dependent dehydrogenase (short-subunit alcohol dehydrogenase family)
VRAGNGDARFALNAVTLAFAKELSDTPIKVNAADPGYTSDFSTATTRGPGRGQSVPAG